MKKIHSCPFCGFDKPEIASCRELDCDNLEQSCDCDSISYCVNCNVNKGGCGAAGGYETTVQKAIDKWNEREYFKTGTIYEELSDWDMYRSFERESVHLHRKHCDRAMFYTEESEWPTKL